MVEINDFPSLLSDGKGCSSSPCKYLFHTAGWIEQSGDIFQSTKPLEGFVDGSINVIQCKKKKIENKENSSLFHSKRAEDVASEFGPKKNLDMFVAFEKEGGG